MNARIAAAMASQWTRPPAAKVDLVGMPLPVSTNSLWRMGNGRPRLSKQYAAWKTAAARSLDIQRPGRVPGRFHFMVLVPRVVRLDLDNCIKCYLDLLQASGVVENDKLVESVRAFWSDTAEGVCVTVTAVNSLLHGEAP